MAATASSHIQHQLPGMPVQPQVGQADGSGPRRIVVRRSELPASLRREAPPYLCHTFSWSAPERIAWRRPPWMPPSKWAERHIILPTGPGESAPFSLRLAPHMAGILDTCARPHVRTVAVCGGPQSCGKTTLAFTVAAWRSIYRPGPTMYVYPTEDQARENLRDRLVPLYEHSPVLRRLLTGRQSDIGSAVLRLRTMYHRVAWATSRASLANRSIYTMIADEVDKWVRMPDHVESGSRELMALRLTAYPDHLLLVLSSPSTEGGLIWQDMRAADLVARYHLRCPACGQLQSMSFSRIRWPRDATGEHSIHWKRIQRGKLARYHCVACPAQWDDLMRDQAARSGQWRVYLGSLDLGEGHDPHAPDLDLDGGPLEAELDRRRPESVGFLLPAWASPMVSMSASAVDWLRSLDRDLDAMTREMARRNFWNARAALPWVPAHHVGDHDRVLELRGDLPKTVLPPLDQVSGLVAGIDTQDDGFWYLILAMGYGQAATAWVVRHGFVPSFEALDMVLWDSAYRDPDGGEASILLALQDALGHRTSEVYDYCSSPRCWGKVIPSIGRQTAKSPVSFSPVEFHPGQGGRRRRARSGLRRALIHTTYWKDAASARLGVAPGDPGGLVLHADADEDLARQLTSEYRDTDGHWAHAPGRPNHLWDCLCLALAAADILGLRQLRPPGERPARPQARRERQPNPFTGGRKMWG